MSDAPSPQASAAVWRAFVSEAAERAAFYAEHAARYAAIGDDAGLNRSVRLMSQLAVKAAEGLPRLAEAARQDRAMRDMARQG